MAKKEILELIIDKRFDTQYSLFEHPGFMFAFCKEPEKGIVRLITHFAGCREDLSGKLYNNRSKIPINCLRLLVRMVVRHPYPDRSIGTARTKNLFKRQTRTGLRIINIMEKRHNWPLTKMYDVASRIDKKKQNSWSRGDTVVTLTTHLRMLEASNKWMRSPHMISLFGLLFRLHNKSTKFDSINSYKALKKACESCKRCTNGDAAYVAKTFKFWDPLMEKFDEVFKGLPFTKAYSSRNYDRYHYDEGIHKLCRFQSTNAQISEQFSKVMKTAGIR